ncbi:hypothetical protein F2P79_016081 [Pimephales promelas]|nr:hypothetical protein F2P79_016081 [Pimephales promelas]
MTRSHIDNFRFFKQSTQPYKRQCLRGDSDREIQLPHEIIATGDSAYLTLSLVCRWFRDVVTNEIFQKAAHFAWLDCVVNWKKNSPDYCDEFRRIYSFRECLELFLSPIHQGTGEEED